MRRRVHARPRAGKAVVRVVPVAAVRLVTLDDPTADPEGARGAFARLRPPEGTSAAEIGEWRARVAPVARAVRVLAPPREDAVALALTRVNAEERIGDFREEATALAAEAPEGVAIIVAEILDEVGA